MLIYNMINYKYLLIFILSILLIYSSYFYLHNNDFIKNYFFQKNEIIDEKIYNLDKNIIIKLLNQK